MKINKLGNAFSRVIVGRDYGPTGIIDLWILGRIKKRPGLGSLCNRYCLVFFVDKFIVEHSFGVFCNSFLSCSKISTLLLGKSRIVELAITFV